MIAMKMINKPTQKYCIEQAASWRLFYAWR